MIILLNKQNLPPPPFYQRYPKCNISAERCRLRGNKAFMESKFKEALLYYNGSLCYAPPGSKDIPLVYGNRSAVYCEMGKYALAIENIELARKNGFPAEKMAQLDVREEKCKKLMETHGSDKNFDFEKFFKLSHPPNKKIPFIADCLELRKNKKYGRHVVTTKDLKTGDIIAIETHAVAFPNAFLDPTCAFCTKTKSGSLIPCSHCSSVMFCSEECKQKAAVLHLGNICNGELSDSYKGIFLMTLKMILEAFRVAGGVDELLELLKDAEGKTIFDFDFSNPDDPSYEKNMLIALNGLWRITGSHEAIEVKPEELLNIPPINEKPRTAKERKQLLKFIIGQLQICFSNLATSKTKHSGILLFKALLNHSCLPNVISVPVDRKVVTLVKRPIKAGEQIFDASGNVRAETHPKEERQKFLQIHKFKCDCEACANDYPQVFPRKDSRFVEPNFVTLNPTEAAEQFKKNCKYIDENADKYPCYEISRLIDHNDFLIRCITEI